MDTPRASLGETMTNTVLLLWMTLVSFIAAHVFAIIYGPDSGTTFLFDAYTLMFWALLVSELFEEEKRSKVGK